MKIKVLKDILGANEQIAKKNRELLDSKVVFSVNVMSSPGAGSRCRAGPVPSSGQQRRTALRQTRNPDVRLYADESASGCLILLDDPRCG